ncbi:uncharacterized protein LOC121865492 isoform X10 [Homarus americanus]|uniref:uncharacterized protein LOC121865492 isoform X10 n=1 Tax=Homarus americanus TaxID=6706 RepID=UPI001C468EC1|nr:uncharacterized protein LOC121865492 isoform X10 [Homarus americanus]
MMASGSPPPHQQEHHHERPPPSLDPHLLHGSSVASSGAGVVAGGGGTKGGCGRCGQAFSIFFNKRVQCGGGCGLPVCRKCAPWSTAAQTYVCGVCSTQQPQSTTHAATTTPKTPDDAHLRQVEDSVRSHIEALVESQVGGPLDQVTAAPSTTQPHPARLDLDKISENSKWDLLLYYYCFCHEDQEEGGVAAASTSAVSPSAAAAAAAAAAAFLSPMGDRPLPTEDLPTSRHTQLSDQLTHAIKDAMILPRQMEGYDPAVSPETPVEDFNSHTYEDILATAILNKVLESCEGGRPNEVTIEVSHDVTSTDTDSGMSGGAKESRRGRHKRSEVSEAGSEGSEERSLTPPRHPAHRPTTISPDQGVVTDDCWANAVTTEGAPLQFKIEEHVEEITTHHLTDDDQDLEGIYDEDVSDSGGSWRGSRCSLDDSRERRHHKVSHHSVTEDPLLSTINVALPDPAHITSRRVSFPELGADIIHDSYADADECEAGPGDMVVDSETWEENWLFRRQRLVGAAGSDPVTMLIPNPEAHVPATVGNRDVDELSELSEQQSFGSGEPWSDSEGEGEAGESYQPSTASRELSTLAGEIVAEFAQQDQEYTVDYSVPSRVTTASTTQQGGGRKHSPTQPSPTQSHKSSTMPQSVHYLYTSHKEVPTGYHDGKTVEGIRNPVIVGKPRVDPDTISDSERPVPKPRKLSLATTPPSKTSMKSPLQLLPSPAEDLTILSPPLDMPHPKNVSSTSETVWFVETPEDYTVMQGRTLRLACQVNTKKPMGLSWYHNGSLVPVNHRDYWVFRRGSHHHLHVYGMTPSAAGVYAAAAYTTTHCVWVFCRVQHKANSRPQKRPTFTKGLSDITLEEGGELNLQCQVQGHPEPRVIFSRGLVKLEPSSRLAVESDQYGTWTLRLAECTLADSGEITATAFNMMSTITTRCHVRIVPEGTPIPQQDRTDTGRLKPSSSQVNKQQDPRPGGRHNRKKHNPGSYPSNTTRPTSGNLLTSAKTSSLPHRDQLTTSSGVNTDVDDLDDIQQVPTRPGTIADREHRKWEAAVSLPNNPYAPERLVQRLSLCHTSDHTPQPRRTLSVEFPEEGEKEEVDPSLRDGVPPKTDLNRYSRDYYVTPATGVRASSKNFKHQKSQQQQHQEPQAHQQKKQHQQQQQPGHQQQSYKTHQHLTLNGHQAVTRTSSDFSSNAQIHIIGGGLQNTNKSNSEATLHCLRKAEVESSRPSDWKDELRDIQAAHVEQEVAKFQQTIDETQRRWEENYARVVPRSTHTNGQSDSSTEVLHNPRVDAYLVPPRHDLWRTVSEDTIAAQPRDRTVLQPFLRHTSVDNLQPSTKVSNLRNLGSLPQQNMNSMNSVSSMSNININSVTGLGKSANYQHQTHYNRSMESMSTYSDGESQGEGIDSDASTRTPDEMPVLPSVRKLACKFDQASQERVNDLDKRGKDNALSYYGKKNILLIEKSTFSDQPYTRSFTNNLNKRTEKPYIVKEVHSLTARSVPRQFREGLRNSHTISQDLSSKPPSHHSSHSPRRDAPSPEHLGIPWGPAAIPIRPTQIHGDTSDDSSATSGSPRRVPRRRSGGRRDHPGWYARPECGSLTDPATHAAADSFC